MHAPCLNCDIVNAYEKFLYLPTEIANQLINVICYDYEPFKRDRAIRYAVGFYPLSKTMGNYDRESTTVEIEKSRIDENLMEEKNCTSQMFKNLRKIIRVNL